MQKHAASRLHYDLRLLHQGVLLSWAVPKGPSLKPSDRRLAIHVEDHPADYGDFEGTIPEGEYGAGAVLLWDRGDLAFEGDPDEGLEDGKLRFRLDGQKLKGGFQLVRMDGDDNDDQWLLIKQTHKHAQAKSATPITRALPKSVKSQRTLEEIEGAPDSDDVDLHPSIEEIEGAVAANLPEGVRPLLPSAAESVPGGDDWLHEIKWDGYRLLAEKRDGKVRLITRNGNDWTDRFPDLADQINRLCEHDFLVDGEAVALESSGRSDFQRLQNVLRNREHAKVYFYAFDLLFLCAHDLRKSPLQERKDLLRHWLYHYEEAAPLIRYSDHLQGSGDAFFQRACEQKLEGIVSKRARSSYRGGRSKAWLKVKCGRRQEFVIIGCTPPNGSRKHFGSLLLGTHADGQLTYAGRVGTGFDDAMLEAIHGQLKRLERKTPPVNDNDKRLPKKATWVTPRLVAEVAYAEMTNDGLLRHPAFVGLREDKPAEEVGREETVSNHSGEHSKSGPPAEAETPAKASNQHSSKDRFRGVSISHPHRVMDPETEASKADIAAYYHTVAEAMLPYVAERPVSLLRCPNGRHESCFYQKHFEDYVPDGVEIVELKEKKGRAPYAWIKNASALISLAQYGVIEIHGWGSKVKAPEKPDQLIFDLDPDDAVPWAETVGAAFLVRDILADIGLDSLPKVTGGKGLHVCVPLTPRADWDAARAFAHGVAEAVAGRNPKRFLTKASKEARKGRIFVDYLRNGYGATAVAPYSLRARPGLPVAVPIAWDELDEGLRPNQWNLFNIGERLHATDDPWSRWRQTRQSLTQKRLEAFSAS